MTWPGVDVLGRPFEQPERPIVGVPEESLVVDGEGSRREQLSVIPAIDDLVDVAERYVGGRHAGVDQKLDLLEAKAPPSQCV